MTEAGPVDLIDDDADDLDDVLPPPPEGEHFCCLLGAIKAQNLDRIITASPVLIAFTCAHWSQLDTCHEMCACTCQVCGFVNPPPPSLCCKHLHIECTAVPSFTGAYLVLGLCNLPLLFSLKLWLLSRRLASRNFLTGCQDPAQPWQDCREVP